MICVANEVPGWPAVPRGSSARDPAQGQTVCVLPMSLSVPAVVPSTEARPAEGHGAVRSRRRRGPGGAQQRTAGETQQFQGALSPRCFTSLTRNSRASAGDVIIIIIRAYG